MRIFILILITVHFALNALRDGFIYKYIINSYSKVTAAAFKKYGELYHSVGFINETIIATGVIYIFWGLHGLYPAILFLVVRLVPFDIIYNLASGRRPFQVGTTALYDRVFTSICDLFHIPTEITMGILKAIVTILTIIFIIPHY